MAEIELGVLHRQCLDRRIASRPALDEELEAWVTDRNGAAMRNDGGRGLMADATEVDPFGGGRHNPEGGGGHAGLLASTTANPPASIAFTGHDRRDGLLSLRRILAPLDTMRAANPRRSLCL